MASVLFCLALSRLIMSFLVLFYLGLFRLGQFLRLGFPNPKVAAMNRNRRLFCPRYINSIMDQMFQKFLENKG
jgi:hypothetical protein